MECSRWINRKKPISGKNIVQIFLRKRSTAGKTR